jgi:hypothetical protein
VAIKRAEPPRPSQLRPDLPPTIDGWFERALAREPSQRFLSAREMAEELERAIGMPSVMGSVTSLVATGAHQAATISGASLSRSGTVTASSESRRTGVVLAVLVGGALLGGGVGAAALLMTGPSVDSAAEVGASPPATAPGDSSEATAVTPSDATTAGRGEGGAAGEAAEAPDAEAPTVEVPEVPLQRSPGSGTAKPVGPGPRPVVPGKDDERSKRAGDALGI